jgi:hypothetical protein
MIKLAMKRCACFYKTGQKGDQRMQDRIASSDARNAAATTADFARREGGDVDLASKLREVAADLHAMARELDQARGAKEPPSPAPSRILGFPASVGYHGNVSTEPLAVIEAQVCHASDGLVTSRSRRLFNEIMQLRSALTEVTSVMEAVARSSFAGSAETFEADWSAQDPEGYAAWSKSRSVLGDRS